MLREKCSGDTLGSRPKRETDGQAVMARVAGNEQEVELQKYSDSEGSNVRTEDESAQRGEREAAVPEKQPVLEKLSLEEISRTEEEDEERRFFQESQVPRARNLFFSPQGEGREFTDVLKEVQEYISSKHSTLIIDRGSEDVKDQIKRYITKYVQGYWIAVKGVDRQELADTIYTEMAEFPSLTKYVFGTGIEEVNSTTRSQLKGLSVKRKNVIRFGLGELIIRQAE